IINSADVREALQEPIRKVIGAIKSVLERTPPELAADLVGSGITLCGGGSLLRGLPELIERETELETRVADKPLETVARGTCIFLENLELYSQLLEGGEDLAGGMLASAVPSPARPMHLPARRPTRAQGLA